MPYFFLHLLLINNNLTDFKSHIGMIIHSTTLDTQDKVKAIYGGDTWIQHSGYMLRGATSGVTPNSASKTGGKDSVGLNANNIPSLTTGGQSANHTHRYDHGHEHNITTVSGGAHAHNVASTNTGTKGSNQARIASVGSSGNEYRTTEHTGHSHGISGGVSGTGEVYTGGTLTTSGTSRAYQDHTHTYTNNSKQNVETLPQYKSVYIWERTA